VAEADANEAKATATTRTEIRKNFIQNPLLRMWDVRPYIHYCNEQERSQLPGGESFGGSAVFRLSGERPVALRIHLAMELPLSRAG